MADLNGMTAVITGGAMGIGLATARRLQKEGVTLVLWDLNAAALEEAKKELSASGKVFTFVCDVSDREKVYQAARETLEAAGNVDILINNAGIVFGGDLLEGTDDEWEKTINVNLTALVYTTRAFLPGMYERNRGHIVNISSAASTLGVGGLSVYTATKWAVQGLTESLRFEAYNRKKHGVKFYSIHPSYIKHGLFAGARFRFPGKLIVPLIKDHGIIANAIVNASLKHGRLSPKRPLTVHLTPRLRGLLPDSWFQNLIKLLGIPDSMSTWTGRKKN